MIRKQQQTLIAFTLILLLAFALRVFRIGSQSFWWDEGISLFLATSTWPEIIINRANNIHPPLYFFLLNIWVNLTGVTPFASRYFSALISVGQVTAVYLATKNWFKPNSKWIPLLTAFLVAISPLSIIYGQEVRVYAFMPIIYFGIIELTRRLIAAKANGQWQLWLIFGAWVWLGLHLHYISGFMILYCGLWAMGTFLRRQAWGKIYRLIGVAFVVFLASLPWFLTVYSNLDKIQKQTSAGTFLTEPVPYDFLLKQIWLFHLTGLAGALRFDWLMWLATAVAIFTLLLLFLTVWQVRQKTQLVWATFWFIPLASALYVWSVRSYSHPRYISMFAMGLFPLLSALALYPFTKTWRNSAVKWLGKGLGIGLLTAVFAISVISLQLYYFDPAVEKDNMRGVAHFLEANAQPNDIIIIPDTDYSLLFEYDGDTPIVMADLTEPQLFERLGGMTATAPTVYLVDYAQRTRDWQKVLPYALSSAGVLKETAVFEDLLLHQYIMERPIIAPEFAKLDTAVSIPGNLRLLSASVEPVSNATDAVTVALTWQTDAPIPHRLEGTLRLLDGDGWELTQKTIRLVDDRERPTELWAVQEPIITYHTLPIPEGVVPSTYVISLDLFTREENGLTFFPLSNDHLGATTLERTVNTAVSQPQTVPHLEQPIFLAESVTLLGYTVDRAELFPGQSMFVQLLWSATGNDIAQFEPVVKLVQDGEVITAVSTSTTLTNHPPTNWQMGERVLEHRQLIVPPTASGTAQILLTVGNQTAQLGDLRIIETDRQFAAPQPEFAVQTDLGTIAHLVGFDLSSQSIAPDQPITLTLHWQALSSETTVLYKVFVHLLNENDEIIGQSDGEPSGGQRPFTGWLQNEFVTDVHVLNMNDGVSGGENGRIVIGIYDPATGTRLQEPNGNDHIILPIELTIND